MIKNWFLKGDTHGLSELIQRTKNLEAYEPSETAIVVLGDLGANFYLNKTDQKWKEKFQSTGYTVFAVRGNHEARPQNLPHMNYIFHKDVQGGVYVEDNYPNIFYFMDYGTYTIAGYHCLVIGGAYSVDKWYRLARKREGANSWCGWWSDEQLSSVERTRCRNFLLTSHSTNFDFVLTHTCPISYEPTDLFLDFIEQSTVDKTMEKFLEEIKNILTFKVWCFGHYHADRLEKPGVQQFYRTIETFDEVYNRWYGNPPTIETDYWIPKSPYYYEDQN